MFRITPNNLLLLYIFSFRAIMRWNNNVLDSNIKIYKLFILLLKIAFHFGKLAICYQIIKYDNIPSLYIVLLLW